MNALRVLTAMFDIDTGKAVTGLKQLDAGISSAKGALTTLASSVIGAFSIGAFKHFITDQIELGSKINDTAEKLGVGTDELQQFQYAAKLVGVEAEGAGAGLNFLNKNMGAALEGNKEAVETFAKLKVSLKDGQGNVRELGDVIPELADAFEGMGSAQERTAMAMKIFGKQGAALIPLLKEGSGGLREMYDEFQALGGGMQDDFIKQADKAGDEIDKLKFAMTGLKSRIAVAVLPSVIDFTKKLQSVAVYAIKLTKETNIVKEGLALLGAVGAVAGLKAALGWAKFFGIFPKGNAGILKTLASMGYIGLIIAAVAALALIFEDLFVGISGGNSIIRKWLNETLGVEDTNALFAQLGQIVDQIKGSFANMSPAVASLVKMFAGIVVSPYFVATIEFIVRLLGSMVALLVAAARAAGNIVTGDFKGAGKAVDEGGDAVFGKNGFFGENAFKPYAPAAPTVGAPGGAPSNVQIDNNAKTIINVNGAGDPAEVGSRVASFQRDTQNENAAALAALAVGAVGGRGGKL